MQAQVNKWPDPLQDKFQDVYKVEYGRATAYREIEMLMDTSDKMIMNITKQMDEPEKNYSI